MATNFLRPFKAGSARLALVVGASGVLGWDWVAGRIYIRPGEDAAGSGFILGSAMALGYRFMGIS